MCKTKVKKKKKWTKRQVEELERYYASTVSEITYRQIKKKQNV